MFSNYEHTQKLNNNISLQDTAIAIILRQQTENYVDAT